MLEEFYNLLPRRSLIHYRPLLAEESWKLEDLFIRYSCKDCSFSTPIAGEMVHHQTQWHPWWTWWKRLKES